MSAAASARGRRNRRAGSKREYNVADHLEDKGYVVAFKRRRNGEQGFDLLAVKPGEILMVEVKSGPTPYSGFPPADRGRLLERARQAGALAVLAHWPFDGKGAESLRFYFPGEWPS